jgi:hypothetical protein
MMKSTGEWSWKVCLGWILEDQEKEIWGWFSLLIGLIYWSAYICVLRALCCEHTYPTDIKQDINMSAVNLDLHKLQ